MIYQNEMRGSVSVKPSCTSDLRAYIDIPYKPPTAPDVLTFENEMTALVWHRVKLSVDLPASLNVPYTLDLPASFSIPFQSSMLAKIEVNKHAGKTDLPGNFEIVKFLDLHAELVVRANNMMWAEIHGKERPSHVGYLVCTSHLLEPLCIMKSENAKFNKRLLKQQEVLWGDQRHVDSKGLFASFNKFLGIPVVGASVPPEQRVHKATLAEKGEVTSGSAHDGFCGPNIHSIPFGSTYTYLEEFGRLYAQDVWWGVLNKRPRSGFHPEVNWLRGFIRYNKVWNRLLEGYLEPIFGCKNDKLGYLAWVKDIVHTSNLVQSMLIEALTFQIGVRYPKDNLAYTTEVEHLTGDTPKTDFSIDKLYYATLAAAGILVRVPHIREHVVKEIYWTKHRTPDLSDEFGKLAPALQYATADFNPKNVEAVEELTNRFVHTVNWLEHNLDRRLSLMYRLLFGFQVKHIVPTFEMAAQYLLPANYSKTIKYDGKFTKVLPEVEFLVASANAKDTTASNIFEHLVLQQYGGFNYSIDSLLDTYLWLVQYLVGERTPKDCGGNMLPHLWLPDHMNLNGSFDRTKLLQFLQLLWAAKDDQPGSAVNIPGALSIARFIHSGPLTNKLWAATIPGTAPVIHTDWPGYIDPNLWLKGWQGSGVPFEITKLLNVQFLNGDWDDTERINDPFYDTLRKMIKNRNSTYIQMI